MKNSYKPIKSIHMTKQEEEIAYATTNLNTKKFIMEKMANILSSRVQGINGEKFGELVLSNSKVLYEWMKVEKSNLVSI